MTEQGSRQALRPSAGGMVSLSIMNEAARLKAGVVVRRSSGGKCLVKDDALNILRMVHVIEGLYTAIRAWRLGWARSPGF